jgi:ribonuclease P protein component
MLPRSQRLRSERDFRSVLRTRAVIRGKFLTLRAVPNATTHDRYGFVVSRRTAKRAVDRNLIKRRLRSVARTIPPHTPAYDFLVVAQPAGLKQPQTALAVELNQLITRLTHGPRRH